MPLTYPTFDGVSFSPYWLQIHDPDEIPYQVRFSPSGVKHCSLSANTEDYELLASGFISSTLFDSLKAKLGTQGTLTASQGSCTAILVTCEGTPRPASIGGGAYGVDVVLAWIQVTAWA